MKLHYEAISKNMKELLGQLMVINELSSFRLVGGTSLALQFGHRTSVDLDLFAEGGINVDDLLEIIREHFKNGFELITKGRNGISGIINRVKVDLFDWKVPYAENALLIDGLRLASPPDIFASKCEAVLDRRSEKDFCDIGEIVKHHDLSVLLQILKTRYPYITTGSIFAILMKEEIIVRDNTIRFFQGNSFNKYADLLKIKLVEYEQRLQGEKKQKEEERINRVQSLIEQKRKKQP